MTRIVQLDPHTATGPAKTLFEGIRKKLGVVPNLFRVLGNAPAALQGYLSFHVALNIFSNYINHAAGTVIDFPEVTLTKGCAATSCACG